MFRAYQTDPANVFDTYMDDYIEMISDNHISIGADALDGRDIYFNPYVSDLFSDAYMYLDGDKDAYSLVSQHTTWVHLDIYDQLEQAREMEHRDDAIIRVLSLITGHKWDYREIHGCVQGEWAQLFYDDTVSIDFNDFESRYFNLGSEWEIVDDEGEEVWCYITAWDDDAIVSELASIAGCERDEIKVFGHDVFYGFDVEVIR